MNQVCQDLPALRGRWGNRRSHLRLRFREETRVTQDFPAPQVIQAIQDLLVPPAARKETKENQEKPANGENQAKTVTPVLQASLESKESQACQVHQAGTERED